MDSLLKATCILVVEDDAIIAEDIQLTLQSLGYVVPPPVASCDAAFSSLTSHHPDLTVAVELALKSAARASRA